MAKSIETIWKDGFVGDMALIAPKVNDLYNQKSKNVIDRFELLFAQNHKALLIGAVAIVIVFSYWGAPLLGMVVGLMLTGLVAFGKKQLQGLQAINKDVSSFEYLKSFNSWLDQAINQYVMVYRFFYPILFLLCALRFVHSEMGAGLIGTLDTDDGVFGIPFVALMGLGILTVLIAFFSERIYRADVNLYYGKEIQKLKALIAEMEQLKA